MDAAKAAIAHCQHVVTGPRRRQHGGDQPVDVIEDLRAVAQRPQGFPRVPAQRIGTAAGRMTENEIGLHEAATDLRLHGAQLHRVRARFQQGQDASLADPSAQAGYRRRDSRGVMGEIVINRDATRSTAVFQAAAHAAKSRERRDGLRWFHATMGGGGNGSDGIAAVVVTRQAQAQRAQFAGTVPDGYGLRGRSDGSCTLAPMPSLGPVEDFDRAPDTALEDARQGGIATVHDDAALARNTAQQVVELGLDRAQVGKNIGMVELEIVEHGGRREVMNELAALVEKRRVVFIGLDDKGFARAQARGYAKIQRYATNEEPGILAGMIEDPRNHRCGGGLAMGTRNGNDVTARQQMPPDPGGPGIEARTAVEYGFEERIAPRDHVTDKEQVGSKIELQSGITFDHIDAGSPQLLAHGRVNRRVATGDTMSSRLREAGDAAHEGPADSQDVQVHVRRPIPFEGADSIGLSSQQQPVAASSRGLGRLGNDRAAGSIARPDLLPAAAWRLAAMAVQACAHWAGKATLNTGGSREELQLAIATLAARLMAEDGLELGPARHKAAVVVLGAQARAGSALPDHEQVETALRCYLREHDGAAHRQMLLKLRLLAVEWMQILAPFQPHLVGPVLNGSATLHSHLHLHLFTDSAKDVEMALLDRGLDIRVGPADDGPAHAQEVIGFMVPDAGAPRTGRRAAMSATPIMLTVLDTTALRHAPSAQARRHDPNLHAVERSGRANLHMLRELLDAPSGSAAPELIHA